MSIVAGRSRNDSIGTLPVFDASKRSLTTHSKAVSLCGTFGILTEKVKRVVNFKLVHYLGQNTALKELCHNGKLKPNGKCLFVCLFIVVFNYF